MLVSTRGRYALLFMIYVARASRTRAVSVRRVAMACQLSPKYLEQLAHAMLEAGLLTSLRGARGGYRLSRDAATISAGDILRAAEGSTAPVECPVLTEFGSCPRQDVCATLDFWTGLDKAIDAYVDGVSLAALAFPQTDTVCPGLFAK